MTTKEKKHSKPKTPKLPVYFNHLVADNHMQKSNWLLF